MKTLEEKKLLVKMAKALGQPVDQALVESIEREEKLTELFFGKKEPVIEEVQQPEPVVLQEAEPPPPPPPAVVIPPKEELVQQVANVLSATPTTNVYRDKEIEGMRRTIAEMMQKIATLSWGGGGTGVVRFDKLDDHGHPSDIDYITFNQTQRDNGDAGNTSPAGTMWWNPIEECLNIKQNQTTLQVGLEHYTLFHNMTGNTITQGQVVYMSGTNGDGNPLVSLAIANTTIDPYKVLGIVTEDVANNELGRATKFGKVREVNTTGTPVSEIWNTGTQLYLSDKTPGALTNDHPTAPNVAIQLGHAMTIGTANGIILADVEATPRKYYGSFSDTTTQNAAISNSATAVKFNTTDFASGHVVINYSGGTNNAIQSLNHGLYNYQFSCQFTSSSAARAKIWIWIRKNGTDVPNTATVVAIESNGGVSAPAWNFVQSMQPNDVFQLMWATDTADKISMPFFANTSFCPAIPSVILTVTQVAE